MEEVQVKRRSERIRRQAAVRVDRPSPWAPIGWMLLGGGFTIMIELGLFLLAALIVATG